ncbi:MAG: hypothetical protein HZA15_14960 [Nitrospirae bacterium]|nr:hypothetical protein [Nitrospirota bacterium]
MNKEATITLFIFIVVLVMAYLMAQLIRYFQRKYNQAKEIRRGSVLLVIEEFEKDRLNESLRNRLRRLGLKLSRPNKFSLFSSLSFIILLWFLQWIVGKWIPTNPQSPAVVAVSNDLLTLWQVQVGLAGAALPILIFIIEMTKDEGSAVTKSSEVLIRETWIFPIIVLALSSAVKVGIDIFVTCKTPIVEVFNLLIFCLCVFVTIFAYYRALRLMFNPGRLRSKSIKLLKEKMEESIIKSAETRLGNNWMFRELNEAGISWHLSGVDRSEKEKYFIVYASQVGYIVDINVEHFKNFKKILKWKPSRIEPGVVSNTSSVILEEGNRGLGESKGIFFVNQFRDYVRDNSRELILIEKNALEPNSFDEAEADYWANKKIFKIRSEDEG